MPINPFSSASSSTHYYGSASLNLNELPREDSPIHFSAEELRPFRRLETLHRDLFSSPAISEIHDESSVSINPSKIKDVDLDECQVINASRGRQKAIGTVGVSSCIAICARGENRRNETILGLYHYGGEVACSPREALSRLRRKMDAKGASNPRVYLIGGMISKQRSLCTDRIEGEMLNLRSQYNIQGARLHINESESMNDATMSSVLFTPNELYFMKNRDIYEP